MQILHEHDLFFEFSDEIIIRKKNIALDPVSDILQQHYINQKVEVLLGLSNCKKMLQQRHFAKCQECDIAWYINKS